MYSKLNILSSISSNKEVLMKRRETIIMWNIFSYFFKNTCSISANKGALMKRRESIIMWNIFSYFFKNTYWTLIGTT